MSKPGHPSQRLAEVVIGQLLAAGVTDLVLAPGSRSAPLAYAAWQVRDRLRIHVRIDERSAAFLALGLAKASNRPVPVVTTSGTAAGNLLPAAMEAYHARVPLLLITADRPATMINSGANQTTHQDQLFSGHVRGHARLAASDDHPRAWGFAVQRVLALASGSRGATPGPVHVNLGFVDPLTPDPAAEPAAEPAAAIAPVLRTIQPTPVPVGVGSVVVVGDLDPAAGAAIARQAADAGIPLCGEPSSNARAGASAIAPYRLLLGTELADAITQVIMLGRPTLSRPVLALLAREDVALIIVEPDPEWIDPGLHAHQVIAGVDLVGQADPSWLARWHTAAKVVQDQLRAEPDEIAQRLAPWAVAQAVVDQQPDILIIGASQPIRDCDLTTGWRQGEVFANRGLAGIDGFLSTACGIALARPEQEVWAYCGDLTFLHDGNGLLFGPHEPEPRLRIIVANDDGGAIFATLEHGQPERADTFERLFATPQASGLGALCTSRSVSYFRVKTMAALRYQLAQPVGGLEVIEVAVDRTDRAAAVQRWRGYATTATRP